MNSIVSIEKFAQKENFLTYSTQFVFLIMRIVPGNIDLVATDMSEKSSTTREYELLELRKNSILIFSFIIL